MKRRDMLKLSAAAVVAPKLLLEHHPVARVATKDGSDAVTIPVEWKHWKVKSTGGDITVYHDCKKYTLRRGETFVLEDNVGRVE